MWGKVLVTFPQAGTWAGVAIVDLLCTRCFVHVQPTLNQKERKIVVTLASEL
jgi:hypothetical protein